MTDWHTLHHAYGTAENIPVLLNQARNTPTFEVWDELWSHLCHQGTVYSASFAALPELTEIAASLDPAHRMPPLSLASAIILSSDVHRAHREDYVDRIDSTVPRFKELCQESLATTGLPRIDFIYLLQSMLALEGDSFWVQELDHLADGELPGTCPRCEIDLYLVIGEHGFFTTAEEWIVRHTAPEPPRPLNRIMQWLGFPIRPTKPTEPGPKSQLRIRPGIRRTNITPSEGALAEVGQWMLEHSTVAGQQEVSRWIRHVFGSSDCPECGAWLNVIQTMRLSQKRFGH
jgi:hypothetical protein